MESALISADGAKDEQGGTEKVIRLPTVGGQDEVHEFGCDGPEAIKLMIDFLYSGNYEPIIALSEQHSWNEPPPAPPAKSTFELIERGGVLEADDFVIHVPGEEVDHAEEPVVASSSGGPQDRTENSVDDILHSAVRQTNEVFGIGPLTMHSKMYALGSKYGIPNLQALASSKFESSAKGRLGTDDLATAIPVVFGNTTESDDGLRSLLERVLLKNLPFENVIQNIDGLLLNLLKQQTQTRGNKIACSMCGTSTAKACAGRNKYYFMTFDCESRTYCGNCLRAFY